ncbi:TPA: mobilome CxxCx(11)CxxC protein [Citrobacter amalonaticus]|uniref:mobilome CxxCx(11)CxxC protein n=1 Tax=Citrobacter cronae TaxID=1748967 RepID=UPI0021D011D8|nr:mobilome CxxCx(11)CxxC protein [Citrobacter cronae]
MMDEEKTRAEVAHIEFISYGTSRIFDRRMRSLDWKRKVVTFLGAFVPLMIGGAVLSFGLDAPFLPICIAVAGGASIVQLAFSLWSLVSGWDRSYSDCMASVKENTAIYNLARSIGKKIGKLNEGKLDILIDDLTEKYERREQEDLALCVNDKELRYANRVSCFYFKKKCYVCNTIPLTLKPRKCTCDGCGKF